MTDHSISTELLGCPFCGTDKVSLGSSLTEDEFDVQWSVLCSGCGASCSLYCETADEAATSWNMRAITTASDAVGTAENPCPRCHYNAGPEGAERYWEARWRDEKAENERLQRLADERAKELATLRGEPEDWSIEVWNGDRKVTVYKDVVLRVWGSNIHDEISDEPRTLEAVNNAFRWLYAAPDWRQDQAETSRLAGKS